MVTFYLRLPKFDYLEPKATERGWNYEAENIREMIYYLL
jgi:hypothetical protein